jgi:hypothetical protein
MSQDVSLQIEALETQADTASGEVRGQRLGEAALLADQGGLEAAEVTRLYLAAAESAPESPQVYWDAGRQLSQGEVHTLINDALEERSQDDDSSWSAHQMMFKNHHLGADRRLDGALRDLVRKNPDAYLWQAYRFVELNKWRNVQQVFAE